VRARTPAPRAAHRKRAPRPRAPPRLSAPPLPP
jgi:hypothetical protein